MASAKAKIRHVFGDTFSCRAAPPDILVKLSGKTLVGAGHVSPQILRVNRISAFLLLREEW